MTEKNQDGESRQLERNVRLRVIVTNEILGNSERIMTLDQIQKFNLAAYYCAQKAIKNNTEYKYGMWTIKVA